MAPVCRCRLAGHHGGPALSAAGRSGPNPNADCGSRTSSASCRSPCCLPMTTREPGARMRLQHVLPGAVLPLGDEDARLPHHEIPPKPALRDELARLTERMDALQRAL